MNPVLTPMIPGTCIPTRPQTRPYTSSIFMPPLTNGAIDVLRYPLPPGHCNLFNLCFRNCPQLLTTHLPS